MSGYVAPTLVLAAASWQHVSRCDRVGVLPPTSSTNQLLEQNLQPWILAPTTQNAEPQTPNLIQLDTPTEPYKPMVAQSPPSAECSTAFHTGLKSASPNPMAFLAEGPKLRTPHPTKTLEPKLNPKPYLQNPNRPSRNPPKRPLVQRPLRRATSARPGHRPVRTAPALGLGGLVGTIGVLGDMV